MTDHYDRPRQHDDSTVVVELNSFRADSSPLPVTFHRRELDAILRLYGRMVAENEWRDYAIDHLKDQAVFSVFRRTSEVPLFRIEKTPRNAKRQGAFSIKATNGAILKRGHDLQTVLRFFEKKPKIVHY